MKNTLTEDFFELSCRLGIVQALIRQIVGNLDELPQTERQSDALTMAILADEKASSIDDLLTAMTNGYEQERRTVQIELEATMTISTSTVKRRSVTAAGKRKLVKNAILEYCKANKTSIQELADMAGMSEEAVSFLANDVLRTTTSESLLRLAEIVGAPVKTTVSADALREARKNADDAADEIYVITHDARLAKFLLNELMDNYFDRVESEVVQVDDFKTALLVGYLRAQAQAEIANRFVVKLVKDLEAVEAMVRGK